MIRGADRPPLFKCVRSHLFRILFGNFKRFFYLINVDHPLYIHLYIYRQSWIYTQLLHIYFILYTFYIKQRSWSVHAVPRRSTKYKMLNFILFNTNKINCSCQSKRVFVRNEQTPFLTQNVTTEALGCKEQPRASANKFCTDNNVLQRANSHVNQ